MSQTIPDPISSADSAEAECYRAPEVAKMLDVSRARLYEMARRGQVPHKRVGRTLLFPRSVLRAWLNDCAR